MRVPDPFSRRAMALSFVLHSGLFFLGWLSTFHRPTVLEFVTYEIELVSPPPAVQAEQPERATEELVVERPEPEPVTPEPEPDEEVVPVEEQDEEPPPTRVEDRSEESPEPDEEESPAATPDTPVEEEPEESGEGINVRLEGIRRDYPEYYNNIIRQIQRCFRWRDGGSWETTVFFVLNRDGTVADLEFVARSGNTTFDFEAMGAVDCAGRGRFGALPEDLPYERLPIQFSFRPTGGRGYFPVTSQTAEVASEQ